jgi:hypothetical protein
LDPVKPNCQHVDQKAANELRASKVIVFWRLPSPVILPAEADLEGIAKAKGEGKYKGRPASIDAAEIRRLTATMGPAAIAKQLGIARSTVYRLLEQTATTTTH